MKTIKFTGINSGDGECFCWEVDEETFIKIKGRKPEIFDYDYNINCNDLDEFDKAFDNDDLDFIKKHGVLRIYPNDIFEEWDENNPCKKSKIKVKIEMEIYDKYGDSNG